MTGQSPKVKLTAEQVAAKLKEEEREVDNSLKGFDNLRHPLRILKRQRERL